MPRLLSIIELGGYPNLRPLCESLGFEVDVVNSQRKACSYLKKTLPDVILAEYNFQSDFRDRTSNLESLMAVVERHPTVKVLALHMPEQATRVRQLAQRHALYATLALPIDMAHLHSTLQALCASCPARAAPAAS